jgi:hypothetical protein
MSFSSSTVISSEESSSEPPGNCPSGSQKTEEVVAPNDNLDAEADQEPITFSSPAFSYVTPKVYLRRLPFGIGMFAKEQIKKVRQYLPLDSRKKLIPLFGVFDLRRVSLTPLLNHPAFLHFDRYAG